MNQKHISYGDSVKQNKAVKCILECENSSKPSLYRFLQESGTIRASQEQPLFALYWRLLLLSLPLICHVISGGILTSVLRYITVPSPQNPDSITSMQKSDVFLPEG